MKLYPIANMCNKRAAHAMVYAHGQIVVAGGIGEDCNILNSCEIYSVGKDEWIEIAPLNVPAMNASICTFNSQFLFKFGGKKSETELSNVIERYDFEFNKWSVVNVVNSKVPRFPSSGCSLQMNNNQMLLFGGTYNSYGDKTSAVYKIIVSSEDRRKKTGSDLLEFIELDNQLPVSEGFWVQQAIILNGSSKDLIKSLLFAKCHKPSKP